LFIVLHVNCFLVQVMSDYQQNIPRFKMNNKKKKRNPVLWWGDQSFCMEEIVQLTIDYNQFTGATSMFIA